MELYLVPSKRTSEILNYAQSTVDKITLKNLTKRSDTSLWCYCNNKSKIPIHVIDRICKLNGKNLIEFINGESLVAGTHSHSVDIFSIDALNLTPYKALILGCIPTEAHLREDAINIEISQNTDVPLELLKKLIIEEYPNVNAKNIIIKPHYSSYFQLVIKSPFLRWLFQNIYEIDEGNANATRKISKPIINATDERIVLGFLGGVFSLEAGFSVYDRDNQAIISLEMRSREFVRAVRRILKNRGYNPSQIKYDRGCWRFMLNKMDENVKLLYELIPWFIHERKLKLPRKSEKSFIEVMKTFVDRIYISNTHIVEFVRKAREKYGSSPKLIKQLNERFNLQLNNRKANRWLYENNRLNLMTVYHLCQLGGYSISTLFKRNILPKHYSILFLINDLIDKKEFEEIRGEEILINI